MNPTLPKVSFKHHPTFKTSKTSGIRNFCFLFLIAAFFFSFTGKAQTGEALQFDGTDDYVALPVSLTGNYTKEVWVNTATLTAFPNILSGTGTALFLNSGRLAAGHSTGTFGQLLDPAPLVAGTWYHVAVTYNATTGEMKLYKNALVVDSELAVPNYTEPALEMGRFAGANYFNGTLDEVRLWNTERSAAEIAASMNCSLTGDEPGLLANYNFNQGIVGGNNAGLTTLSDNTDDCSAANGTLFNFALTGTTSNWVAPGPVLSGTCANSFSNITLTGNNNCITSGDVTPSLLDNTNFGNFGISPISKTFKIVNSGNSVLSISSVVISGFNAADFSITTATATSVAAGDSTSFTITFSPTAGLGVKDATVTINNSDLDEAAFTFNIRGTFSGPGQALSFDGINDRVDLPFVFSNSYTKEAWILTRSLTGFPNILSGNPTTGTALFLNEGRLAAGHGSAFSQVVDPVALLANTWYHVAVTYNHVTGVMNLYRDGALVASNPSVTNYTETMQQIGTFNSAFYFNGNIDEVRFWNVERTEAQINASRNCALNGSEAGLIAYYNFNQGAQGGDNAGVTSLNDLHGNCPLNGTLVNFALTGTVSNWIAPGAPLSGSCTLQVPNISIAGNTNCIETGDLSPSTTDNTDFGVVNNNSTLDKTFVITNNGGETLSITGFSITGADASSFTIVSSPASTVLPGDSTTIVVRFAPTVAGIKNATVEVLNNDANEGVYRFAITGQGLAVVPVSILYFKATANDKVARLLWETTAEINNAGFEIQRSVGNTNRWETIGFVAGTNISAGSKYSFNDVAPLKGFNAYRLKQSDFDGRNAISNVEVINFAVDATSISVYPNPVIDKINLVFNDSKLLNTRAKITSASGTVMAMITLNNYRQQVDLSALATGMYFINLSNGKVLRVIKQ
jgi:Concanavalin A-like lectin/glucanases superfamily/Secretion system C-terminal sorting domain/Protein of unknown function (DUF1573)